MSTMFESATFKLTAWYLLIVMIISLLFSVMIYQIATTEVSQRLRGFEEQIIIGGTYVTIPGYDLRGIRTDLLDKAAASLVWSLVYTNLFILLAGGMGSYFLARRTLRPLKDAHEAQARFTSDASHELRTPLAAMKMELEVALRDPKLSKQEMRELLDSNLEEVNKLSDLSTTLLKISQNDEKNLSLETISLSQLIESTPKRTSQPTRFRIKRPLPAIKTTVNRASIEEVLLILCDNALKYSPKKTRITLSLKRRPGRALIHISNSGQGIAKDQLQYIFERFYRGDQSRTASGANGYGLGLSVAKQLIRLNKGDIYVRSTPGKMTTFTISLPIK